MRTAVLTVFYPGMQPFIDAYIQCINSQSDQGFEMVIVDDAYPGPISLVKERIQVPCHVIESPFTPQQNRLEGLQECQRLGFDLIICSDSDETMFVDRVEGVKRYFAQRPDQYLLFNNAEASHEGAYFDLNYKSVLCLDDIVDFNVLGYGAMNLRASLVPFLVSLANNRVAVFDWWVALRYLLSEQSVEFRPDIKNHYTVHPDHFVGPALAVSKARIEQSIRVKKSMYTEMHAFCQQSKKEAQADLFLKKSNEIALIETYIDQYSMDSYFDRVKSYLERKDKIYWWQEAVSLSVLAQNQC